MIFSLIHSCGLCSLGNTCSRLPLSALICSSTAIACAASGTRCSAPVKEQQERIGSAEFRNTQFSYSMGEDGVEKFVSTPELYSANSIDSAASSSATSTT